MIFMFNRVKNNYRDVAVCSDAENEGRYTFIESYDDDWGEIAERKFEEEFGTKPTRISLESREKI